MLILYVCLYCMYVYVYICMCIYLYMDFVWVVGETEISGWSCL